MHVFKNKDGKSFTIEITIGKIKKIKAEYNVDLMSPETPREGVTDKNLPLLSEMYLDPVLTINIVYLLVKAQTDENGLTDEEFGESLGGKAVGDAFAALMKEWEDFFHECGRDDRAAIVRKQVEITKADMAGTTAAVEAGADMIARRLVTVKEKAMEYLENQVEATLSKTFTDSPES